jgi:hypothetical protein
VSGSALFQPLQEVRGCAFHDQPNAADPPGMVMKPFWSYFSDKGQFTKSDTCVSCRATPHKKHKKHKNTKNTKN